MPRLFGTDGIRGVANVDLTPELAMNVGRAAASAFAVPGSDQPPAVLIVRDTRASGELLEAALSAGLMSAGAEPWGCGVLPTPAAAFLVGRLGAQAAAVISASHNPPEDNGIKFFGPDGFKLGDEEEEHIEKLLDVAADDTTTKVGRAREIADAEALYVTGALRALGDRRLHGMKVVVDCAHGASYRTTPQALERAGAQVVVLNAAPTGWNINLESGSTLPEKLAEAVVAHRADAGLAHDGDADRVIAVDERGSIVDGDAIIAALALELKERDRLPRNLVVCTVMANLGFRVAMDAARIELVEVAVGDRYVVEAMRQHGAGLGGEQSGHVILTEYTTTGDGLVTGLRLLGRMAESGRRLSELASVVERFPQVLINVSVKNREGLSEADAIWEAVDEAENKLGDMGRVLVRPSGTEPLVRVMVEAGEEPLARSTAEEIADVVRTVLGGGDAETEG